MFATQIAQYADEPVIGAAPPAARTATTRTRRCTSRSRSSPALRGREPGAGRRRADRTATPATAPASTPSAGSTAPTGRVPRRGQQRDGPAKTAELRDLQRPSGRFEAALRRHERRCSPAGTARVDGHRARAVGRGLEGHRSLRRARGCARGLPHLAPAAVQSSVAVPRSAPRSPRTTFAQITFAWPPGRHDGVDRARHATTTRRTASSTTSRGWPTARCSSTARWSRTAAGNLSASLVLRHRRQAPRPVAVTPAAGSGRSTSRRTSAFPETTTPRWAAAATGSPTAPRRSWRWTPRTRSGRAPTRPPGGADDYKVAINKSWDENYGAGGAANGGNIAVHRSRRRRSPSTTTTPRTGSTSDAQGPIITAPGSFQSELGCPGDWSPDCMRPWLQDPDGDGTYTWSSDQIPAGSYEFKIAHGLSWDESYGDGGEQRRRCRVPSDGVVVTISLRAGHAPDHASRCPSPAQRPTSNKAKAFWVEPGPARLAGQRRCRQAPTESCSTGGCTGRPTGGLAVDAEAVTGGSAARPGATTRRACPPRWPARTPSSRATSPCGSRTRPLATAGEILRGQVAVGDVRQRRRCCLDATGVQIAWRARRPVRRRGQHRARYGVTFGGAAPAFRLWAPTAQQVVVLTWSPAAATDAPVSQAARTPMERAADGSWSAAAGGQERALPVRGHGVRAHDRQGRDQPRHRPVLGGADAELDPVGGGRPDGPGLRAGAVASDPAARRSKQDVDSTIYELHVRDFSIGDDTVPRREPWLLPRVRRRTATAPSTSRRSPTPGSTPCTCCRPSTSPRSRRTRRRRRSPPATCRPTPRTASEQQACVDAVAGKDGFNWGYDPLPLHGARRGRTPPAATPPTAAARVAEFRTMVGGAAPGRACGSCSTRSSTTPPASGQARHVGARQDRARLLPAPERRRRGRDLDLLPERRHRARRWRRSSWSTRSCCGRATTRSTASASTSWATTRRAEHARRARGARRADRWRRTVSTASRSTSTARAGTSARSRTTPCFTQATQGQLGGTRDRHVLRPAARRRARRRAVRRGPAASRASAAASSPTRTARRSTPARRPRSAARHRPGPARPGRQPARVRLPKPRAARSSAVTRSTTTAPPAGYADQPDEVISYVDAHDNETLFDALTFKLPVATSMAGPRADEHAVAGDHRAVADAVVLARRAPTCCAASRWTATATTAATGSTGSTGPGPTTASATACRSKADNERQVAVS